MKAVLHVELPAIVLHLPKVISSKAVLLKRGNDIVRNEENNIILSEMGFVILANRSLVFLERFVYK